MAYAISSRACLYARGPGGESHDVDNDEQQLFYVARPFEVAAENLQRDRQKGYLPMWSALWHCGH